MNCKEASLAVRNVGGNLIHKQLLVSSMLSLSFFLYFRISSLSPEQDQGLWKQRYILIISFSLLLKNQIFEIKLSVCLFCVKAGVYGHT